MKSANCKVQNEETCFRTNSPFNFATFILQCLSGLWAKPAPGDLWFLNDSGQHRVVAEFARIQRTVFAH